jgi:hypothetical protein
MPPETPIDPKPPTVLLFRSSSGRTEIARRGDGALTIRVLTGVDTLTGDELAGFAAALLGPGRVSRLEESTDADS